MRHPRLILVTSLAVLAGALTPAPAQPLAERPVTISGRATVVDGETLEIRGTRIRLSGIEAPADDHVCAATDDNRWRCGPRAVNALDDFLDERIVSCMVRERATPALVVATCSVGGLDLSLWLVRNGLARAAATSHGRTLKAEDEARAARRGIWSEGAR